MKYRCAIFDMDGTILNTLGDLADSVNFALAHFGYPQRSVTEVRSYLGGGPRNLILRALPEGSSDAQIDECLAFYKPYYESHCNIKTAPYPGILDLLHDLKADGMKIAVVSSKQDIAVQSLSERYFEGLFDLSMGERPGINRKPAPDAIFIALKEMDEVKENAVFIGDSEYDILAARNAEMDGIAVSWGFRDRCVLEENKPQFLADTVSELRALLI